MQIAVCGEQETLLEIRDVGQGGEEANGGGALKPAATGQ